MTTKESPYQLLKNHVFYSLLGLLVMAGVSLINYRIYRKLSFLLYVAALVLCGLVFTNLGQEIYTARRWLNLRVISFMPSDVMKFSAIAFAANFLTYNRANLRKFWKGFIPYLGIVGLSVALIYLQPDLSTIVVIAVSMMAMYLVGGMNLFHLVPGLLAAVGGLFYAVFHTNSQYSRIARITAFLHPLNDFQNTGWQLSQSLFAVSTGSLLGLGLGKSRQKFHYLSEAYNDFIFAIICEELGFLGAAVIIILYLTFIFQGIKVALSCQDRYGKLLATGITAVIGLQAFFNMGVAVGLVPPTGLVLPFISFGGSSLLITLAMVGVLLNIAKTGGKKVYESYR